MAKTIKIKRIELSNFRGRNIAVTPNDVETRISGLNELGKSSIVEAFYWLLSGYTNATSVKNFNLFDNTKPLTHETPATSVKADIDIDGCVTTLERIAKPCFVRKRGTNTYEKSNSDTYTYLIDSIDNSVSDFQAWIERNIGVPMDMLVYCLDGSFFATTSMEDKGKARKCLERIVGEVGFSELKGDYSAIEERVAKGLTIEQVSAQQKEMRKRFEDSMRLIDVKIKSKEDELAGLMQTPFDEIEGRIAEKKASIDEIDNTLLGKAEDIKPILGERDRIFDLINKKTLELNEKRRSYNADFISLKNDMLIQISCLNKENDGIRERNEERMRKLSNLKMETESYRNRVILLEKERQSLIEERDKVKSEVFNAERCPYCGQEMPIDMIEAKRRDFNDEKQRRLEIIIGKGKAVRKEIDRYTALVKENEIEIDKGVKMEESIDLEELKSRLSEIEASYVPFENTMEYADIISSIDALKGTLPEIPSNDTEALTGAKKAIMSEIDGLNRMLGRKDDCEKIRVEIRELMDDRRECANRLAECEGILSMIAEYTEEKARCVSDKVNGRFEVAMIEMFRTQKDGSIAPDCVVRNKDGVMYATANSAQRIRINIDIQRMFCEHYGIVMPIFVDECSMFSPSLEPKFETQNIKLFASDDKVLRVE